MRLSSLVLLLLFVAGVARADVHAGANTLSLTVEPSRITATGIAPGSDVLFFGFGMEPVSFHAVVHRWASVVTDSERTGTVSLTLDKPVTWNTVWIVADLRNGHYATASTPGFPIMRSDFAGKRLQHDPSGALKQFAFARPAADFLYIAPGGGAWTLRARDGNGNDADGTVNGETTLDLLAANPVEGVAHEREFSPGGTLFVIDPMQLDVLELKLTGAILAGAR